MFPFCFTETLEVHDFTFPQEADHIFHIRRILTQTQDIVICGAGLLLGCHILRQIRNGISCGLEGSGGEGLPGSCLGPKPCRVIYIIDVKAGRLQLFHGHIPGQLMHDGADHFKVAQFFCTYLVFRNVPNA